MPIAALINPQSVAVLGASERPSISRSVIETLQLMKFRGRITPVNPKYDAVLGLECVATLADLDHAPDVVVFCLSSARVAEHYRLLPEIGAGAAVIFDSGFSEAGAAGTVLQEEITALSVEADIALCGPNCMGILNPPRSSGTYAQLIHDPAQLVGNVGLIAQSGSVCIGMMSDTRRFGFSAIVSSGNEAVITTADYIDYLVDDPATAVIATFTEAINDAERYVAALDRAAAAGKPVVVLKVGQSARARAAITSHTGALAGETRVLSAVLRAHGAIEVAGLDELTEVLAVCQGKTWPNGHRGMVITSSGGLAELVLDAAPVTGIALPPLSAADKAAMESVIGPVTGDGNPLDAWGSGEFSANLPHALSVAGDDDDIDFVVLANDAFDDQPMGGADAQLGYTDLLAASCAQSTKAHYQLNTRPGLMRRAQVDELAEAGGATVGGVRQGLQAIARVAAFQMHRLLPPLPGTAKLGELTSLLSGGSRSVIHEHEAKGALAAYGVPTTREHLIPGNGDLTDVANAAADMGFPVVLKAVSDAVAHKSDLGLVVTGINDQDELAAAHRQLTSAMAEHSVDPAGILVQEMVTGGVEVFVGIARDPHFGLSISFGIGGVAIELLDDVSLRLLPLREHDAADMIDEIRGAPLLSGYRGAPRTDLPALAACIEAVAAFAWAERDHIAEVDINPVLVLPEGSGCIAVDALIVVSVASAVSEGTA